MKEYITIMFKLEAGFSTFVCAFIQKDKNENRLEFYAYLSCMVSHIST